jgi:transposase
MVKHMVEPSRVVRRLEVITGVGGRRRWSEAEKERITAEAMVPGAVVSEIARRHGMSPQHLFTWRRQARRSARLHGAEAPLFVPAVVAALPEPSVGPRSVKTRRPRRPASNGIELEIGGVAVRVGSDASPKAIAAVIRALKAGS